jgi:hypothetical protein
VTPRKVYVSTTRVSRDTFKTFNGASSPSSSGLPPLSAGGSERPTAPPELAAAPKYERKSVSKEPLSRELYLERVAKHIPVEILALYIPMINAANSAKLMPMKIYGPWVTTVGFFILIPFYFLKILRNERVPTKKEIAISMLAFIVWGYTLGRGIYSPIYDEGTANYILLAFTVFSGFVGPEEILQKE